MPVNDFVNIENLVVRYKRQTFPAVDNLTLSIGKGDIFGLLGPNGAGKTSAISSICGLIKPVHGKILIDGLTQSIHNFETKKFIGLVPQDIALYDEMTANENLTFFGKIYGLYGDKLKSRITGLLKSFGLENCSNQRVKTFSGGMKRRLNLIVGILHEPRLLILDEPTVGVDIQSRNLIIEKLQELNISGTTIIYTSHYLEEAENFCTSLAIIDNGKILIKGTTGDILSKWHGSGTLEDVFIKLTGREVRN